MISYSSPCMNTIAKVRSSDDDSAIDIYLSIHSFINLSFPPSLTHQTGVDLVYGLHDLDRSTVHRAGRRKARAIAGRTGSVEEGVAVVVCGGSDACC